MAFLEECQVICWYLFRPFEKCGGTLYSGVLKFFSTQNQVPQKFIEMSRVIYLIEALSVVILETLKRFSQSEKDWFKISDFCFNFE